MASAPQAATSSRATPAACRRGRVQRTSRRPVYSAATASTTNPAATTAAARRAAAAGVVPRTGKGVSVGSACRTITVVDAGRPPPDGILYICPNRPRATRPRAHNLASGVEEHRGGLTFGFTDIEGATQVVRVLPASYGLALRIPHRPPQ